ncbi:hypothetical protein ACOMHN_025656 [Nucella lapillus]
MPASGKDLNPELPGRSTVTVTSAVKRRSGERFLTRSDGMETGQVGKRECLKEGPGRCHDDRNSHEWTKSCQTCLNIDFGDEPSSIPSPSVLSDCEENCPVLDGLSLKQNPNSDGFSESEENEMNPCQSKKSNKTLLSKNCLDHRKRGVLVEESGVQTSGVLQKMQKNHQALFDEGGHNLVDNRQVLVHNQRSLDRVGSRFAETSISTDDSSLGSSDNSQDNGDVVIDATLTSISKFPDNSFLNIWGKAEGRFTEYGETSLNISHQSQDSFYSSTGMTEGRSRGSQMEPDDNCQSLKNLANMSDSKKHGCTDPYEEPTKNDGFHNGPMEASDKAGESFEANHIRNKNNTSKPLTDRPESSEHDHFPESQKETAQNTNNHREVTTRFAQTLTTHFSSWRGKDPTLLILLTTLLLLPWTSAVVYRKQMSSRVINTRYGKVRGMLVEFPNRHLKPVEAFFGLKYADLEKGNMRFMPPKNPKEQWTKTRAAVALQPPCPQLARHELEYHSHVPSDGRAAHLRNITPFLKEQMEDCLTLNLYVPVPRLFLFDPFSRLVYP